MPERKYRDEQIIGGTVKKFHQKTVFFYRSVTISLLVAGLSLLFPLDAHSAVDCSAYTTAAGKGTLGGVICNSIGSIALMPSFFAAMAYLFGVVLAVSAIAKAYEHVNNPNQTSVWESLKRLVAGAAFFSLPIITEAAYTTIAPPAYTRGAQTGDWNGAVSTGGLDAMLVRLMDDISLASSNLIGGFGYLAGLVFIMIGISRLLKSPQEGARGPAGFGTIMTIIVGGCLFSLDYLLGAFLNSMNPATGEDISTYATLAYTSGMSAAEIGHVHSVISAVLGFLIFVGLISFVRGLFILRDVAEGNQQASMMASVTHLIGGALLVSLGDLINAVQTTLGIDQFGITFTHVP